jgi:glycine betaine/choline ABC-type transport system substrate-binding protein
MQATKAKALTAALAMLAALALLVAGCGGSNDKSSGSSSSSSGGSSAASSQPGKGPPPITIGTKDFTEEFVLGELYALRAKGYTVNLKRNIGSTEIIDKALTSNQIDAYPEYAGETVTVEPRARRAPARAVPDAAPQHAGATRRDTRMRSGARASLSPNRDRVELNSLWNRLQRQPTRRSLLAGCL